MTKIKHIKDISTLIDIADRAITFGKFELERKRCKEDLREAYIRFKKEETDGETVIAHSPEWDEMLKVTKPEFEAFKDAKRQEKNAKARLDTAVRRHIFSAGSSDGS